METQCNTVGSNLWGRASVEMPLRFTESVGDAEVELSGDLGRAPAAL